MFGNALIYLQAVAIDETRGTAYIPLTTVWRYYVKIKNDTSTRDRRDSWQRSAPTTLVSPLPESLLRFGGPPKGPPVSLAVLLSRLSRGRVGPGLASDLLGSHSGDIALDIRIDRETGLVAAWAVRTQSASVLEFKGPSIEISPAA